MGGCQSNQDAEEDHRAVGAYREGTNDADDAAAVLEEASGLGTRIRLLIRCSKLVNMDQGSQNVSDPFVVVLLRGASSGHVRELGRTEVICNTLNPVFVKPIPMTYKFEEVQHLIFRVYDVDTFYPGFDNNNTERIDLSKQDFIGESSCDLASIMGRHGQTRSLPLRRSDVAGDRGVIVVKGEEAPHQNASVRLALAAENLPAGLLSVPDVFVLIERMTEEMGGTRPTPCYKSEVVLKAATPRWKDFELGVQQVCNANFQQPIRFNVFEWERAGHHKLLGRMETGMDALLSKGSTSQRYTLTDGKKGGGGAAPSLVVHRAELIARPSFLDYIRGGCELAFTVAIDFTASNGHPADPRSLHFVSPYGSGGAYDSSNAYIQAILSVGQVLEYYDTDKMFPVFGFGGKLPGVGVSHCFALNGNEGEPEVPGIAGVLEVYKSAIRSYELAGPTFFSEVIQRAAACATHCTASEQKFHVLLIITDGIINDMDATISSIVLASTLPMAILIVGVGNADFSAMDVLDGDEQRLQNTTGRAARDIVQFVPMREFVQPNGLVDRPALSRALLDEIPSQLLSYMQMRGLPPHPPLPPSRQGSVTGSFGA